MSHPQFNDRLITLAGVNITLQGIHDVTTKITPIMSTLLILVQLIAGLYTIYHIVKGKYENKERQGVSTRRRRRDKRSRVHKSDTEAS
jgi:hypothetical protein